MSKTIDERVLEMRFDNKQFEDGVKTSMGTIEKLKEKLSFKGATKGLEEVGAAAKGVNMSPLGSAVEAVHAKFSALQVMGVTALANITNSAVNAGKRIISALTIDPIKTGFNEYETKINAIQTIMSNTASKGTTMEDVTKVIDELNTYADKTIYNFAEMTRNIGTFTAAGVGLEESASAIQGIANLAAASGSTSQQASTAMYQLSQALASGTVKLMDWNSVVNAGMGGQKFQDALKATAKEHGVAVEDMIEKHGSFRETLQEGWLTADILNETLSKFTVEGAKKYSESMVESGKWTQAQADALIKEAQAMEDAATKVKTFTQLWDTLKESVQSGWGKTWEILIGDFEEAKETLTQISDVLGKVIGESADARNKLLEGWKDLGGRKDLVDSLFNIIDAIGSIVKPIKEAFRDIFPATTAEQLKSITENIREFTERLKLSDETADKLKRTFKGLFAIVDIVKEVVVSAVKAAASLFGVAGDLGGGILGLTAKFGDFLVKIRDFIKQSGVISKTFNAIATVIKVVVDLIKKLIGAINGKFVAPGLEVLHSLLDRVRGRMSQLGESAAGMKDAVVSAFDSMGSAVEGSTFYKAIMTLWEGFKKIAGAVGKALSTIGASIVSALSNLNFNGIMDFLNALVAGGVGIGLIKLLKSAKDGIDDLFDAEGGLFKGLKQSFTNISGILDSVRGSLEAWQSKLKAETIMTMAKAIAILAAAILVLSFIDSDKLTNALGAITMLFTELVIAMSIYTTIAKKYDNVIKANTAMLSMSTSVLILAAALKLIGDLEFDQVVNGLVGIAGLMAIVLIAMNSLTKMEGDVMKGASQMLILAAAIKVLASACKDLGRMEWESLAKGLLGVAVLMGIVLVFLNNAKLEGKMVSTGVGILLLASAMKVLASACRDFGRMNWEEIAKSLVSVGVLLGGFAVFTNVVGNVKNIVSVGLSLIAISAAMKIFASAAKDFGNMSWEEIAKGLVAMAGSLLAVVAALVNLPKDMIAKSVGLLAVATALLVMSNALVKMGNMSWESIAKGMVTLGGALIILSVGLKAMTGTASGAGALLVASVALAVLAPVLGILGNMKWSTIAQGLIAIALAFTVLGVAGYALTPVVTTILGLAAAITLIGVGALAFGAGLLAIGLGLSAIAVGITALGGTLVILVEVISSIIAGIIKGIGEGIIAVCEVIAGSAGAIGKALITLVKTICEVIEECTPTIVGTALKLIIVLGQQLVEYTPKIIDILVDFVLAVLDGLARNVPKFVKKIFEILGNLFTGVIEALQSADPDTLIKGLLAIGMISGIMAALAAVSALIPAAMVGVLGMGLVVTELALVLSALGALAQLPGLSWLIEEGGDLLMNIGTAIGKFIGGIAGGIVEGVTSSLPQIANNLSDFMRNLKPFIDGAQRIDSSLLEGVRSLVGIILALTAADIINGITKWITGGDSLSQFGAELASFGENIKAYADSVSGIDVESVKASAAAAKALAEMADTIPNQDGIIAWFTGDNSVSKFGEEIVVLGQGLKGFSDNVAGISAENIVAAANAAKALSEMTASIPNSDGVIAWFAGDNSVAKFATEIVDLGKGLKGFSDNIAGIMPENIVAAANAAKALAEMTAIIPNSDGVIAWFAGDNSVAKFATDIVELGKGLKGFSEATNGIVAENIVAAANAAKALAEMANVIPNQDGMIAWFAGDNTLADFAPQLPILGKGLKGFSDSVAGIVPENVTAAANAAKALAEMSAHIPNQGGIVAWFAGETSVSKFASELPSLGEGIKGFSDKVAGIVPENVQAAATAAKTLSEMMDHIPKEGGIVAWFAGEQSMSKFSTDIVNLGEGLKGFSDKVAGIVPENVQAAATAAKSLAEMSNIIPKEGGIIAWFGGEKSVASFGNKLPTLGEGIKGFSDSVKGISPDNVTAAATAAKTLAEMTETVPKKTDKIIEFGENLVTFGGSLSSYFSSTSEITTESVSKTKEAIKAIKSVTELNSGAIKSASEAIKQLISALKSMKSIKSSVADDFTKALKQLGKAGINALIDAFEDGEAKLEKAGKKAAEAFIDGLEDKLSTAKRTCKDFVKACADAASDKSSSFKSAGKDCAKGFADGIESGTFSAKAAAKAMAKAALEAANKFLDINSPSRVFYASGSSAGEGFTMALEDYASIAYDTSYDMAKSAKSGLSDAINTIGKVFDGDIDIQPSIRPVIDLSDVKSGVSAMSNLLDIGSVVGISSNIGGLNAAMNRRLQNGSNNDVVSAIDKLRKGLDNVGNTNNYINGVGVEDAGVEDAIRTIVRAARVERRT